MGLLLSPDHTATLTDPQTWKDNPFVERDMRRDIKKRQFIMVVSFRMALRLDLFPHVALPVLRSSPCREQLVARLANGLLQRLGTCVSLGGFAVRVLRLPGRSGGVGL